MTIFYVYQPSVAWELTTLMGSVCRRVVASIFVHVMPHWLLLPLVTASLTPLSTPLLFIDYMWYMLGTSKGPYWRPVEKVFVQYVVCYVSPSGTEASCQVASVANCCRDDHLKNDSRFEVSGDLRCIIHRVCQAHHEAVM